MKSIMKLKRHHVILLILIPAVCLMAGAYLLHRRAPEKAVELTPGSEILCDSPVFYLQNDPLWAEERMGEAPDTMGRSGCLVTCLAASMEMQRKKTDGDFRLTPGQLNRELTENGVYDERGNILWQPLREYLSDWEILTPSRAGGDEIEQMLCDGNYPIVKVRMPVSKASHWVLLLEAREGEYYCMDPLEDGGRPVPLSKFQNCIYAVRIVRLR